MKKKVKENGRLIIEPYPSESRFKTEANRTDCSSWAIIHVEICHDYMTTLELYRMLIFDFTFARLSKRYQDKMISKTEDIRVDLLEGLPILNNEKKLDWSKPEDIMNWLNPQVDIWYHKVSKFYYNMWADWCKNMFKVKAMYVKHAGKEDLEGTYNPYEGLRFRLRVEFHD